MNLLFNGMSFILMYHARYCEQSFYDFRDKMTQKRWSNVGNTNLADLRDVY